MTRYVRVIGAAAGRRGNVFFYTQELTFIDQHPDHFKPVHHWYEVTRRKCRKCWLLGFWYDRCWECDPRYDPLKLHTLQNVDFFRVHLPGVIAQIVDGYCE
jgi:hypothetical protein